MTNKKSPSAIISDYLARQPATIKENLVHQIGILFIRRFPATKETLKGFLDNAANDALNPEEESLAIGGAVLVAAALDHILTRKAPPGNRLEQIAKKMDSPILMKLALQDPIKRRHLDAARDEWSRLRKSTLSAEALHKYEATLRMGAFDLPEKK
jgi:hypothetical protein